MIEGTAENCCCGVPFLYIRGQHGQSQKPIVGHTQQVGQEAERPRGGLSDQGTQQQCPEVVVEYPDCSSSVAAVVHMPRRWRDHTKREGPTGFFADHVK